ncbi:phytoene desaturase family protein [Prescottella equi]|jgi:phytoene dehydrogenase-like protein|uniref:phytoene desaturase family protein n=1 Tax=Rhodococcus hoagii TaxID=43767 RepID=UPI0007CD4778|nr:NAD(P)/FAD-dependent oxidoreductase [Prescottella equi]MBM4486324.1 FAD-dependent oxidoreductase [Prescottella equi]NKS03407.1 FAD-dependent oxidoreductase [Prescottella equi]NKS40093.1 FAD-dependent oxidoreductase [Prescottella equi]NKS47876.1 FAD-dependent oxidoreductase [Prescottella equi]ORM02424.1 FAD-dependent oxidoreductase [Prescottella equi]
MTEGVVVGAGPNGLAAAVTLALRGVRVTVYEAADTIGGGTRTTERLAPGLLHDDCSAVHPMGVASPFFRSLDLAAHGLEWCYPEIDLAHPLDDAVAAVFVRSLEQTAGRLGPDGRAWAKLFGPIADRFDDIAAEVLRPIAHLPRHPIALAGFGIGALAPATLTARRWRTDQARALFAGVAAHAYYPLTRPTTAAAGLLMLGAGHRYGWPVAKGGSRAVTDALASLLRAHGGRIETGRRVRSLGELPRADVTLLDLSPTGVADLAGDLLPGRVARAYRRFRYGPAAFKLDLAVESGVPWRDPACRRAGTVHVGGTLEEITAAERDVHRGRMPERPFVLVAQQYLADPPRSAGDVHPVWAYAHVPHGYPGDATEAILRQLERFAPGVRDRIVGAFARSATEMPRYNPNYVGGDIASGANDPVQMLSRPRIALDPYSTGIPGVYICSASTPPGGGVHGMGGHNAALSALRRLQR